MTKQQERIEQLQKEIQILKDAILDTNTDFANSAYREGIEYAEQEICKILDGEIIVDEEEYQEEMAEINNSRIELENSQR